MSFRYTPAVRDAFPTLVTAVLHVPALPIPFAAEKAISTLLADARESLSRRAESEAPPIQAWRRAFSQMGLKPTKYRCASEALLRRLRKEGELPSVHPLVDLCNAVSARYAVPIAVFDLAQVDGSLTVGAAQGTEVFETFSGVVEHPDPGEIIFVDEAHRAHARRWTNRQGARSAITQGTRSALIVSEGLHDAAEADCIALQSLLQSTLERHGAAVTTSLLRAGIGAVSWARDVE